MDRGAWWATVHTVPKSQAGLKTLGMHSTRGTELSAWSNHEGRNKPESNHTEARGTKQNDREGELEDEEFPWSSL